MKPSPHLWHFSPLSVLLSIHWDPSVPFFTYLFLRTLEAKYSPVLEKGNRDGWTPCENKPKEQAPRSSRSSALEEMRPHGDSDSRLQG